MSDSSATTPPPAESPGRAGHDRALGLRPKLEYFYRELKRGQQKSAADQAGQASREKALLDDLIGVADSFEDVFRMGQDGDQGQQPAAAVLDAYRITYDTLIDVMDKYGLHQVPVTGLGYNEVVYRGVRIPEPWSVVGVKGGGAAKDEKRVARGVVRALWVRVVGDRVSVARKAQVTY